MIIVYVKHYLTPAGIDFFKKEWFPKVESILSQQEGFISITYDQQKVERDCMYIVLKFSSLEKLNTWVDHPSHDDLLNALNSYRSRSYWEATNTEEESADPSSLDWVSY